MNTKITNKLIKENIKSLGKEKNITMEEISRRMGKTKSYLSSALSKSKTLISLEIMIEVSSILECQIDELLITHNQKS